jgi:hypothetical protein
MVRGVSDCILEAVIGPNISSPRRSKSLHLFQTFQTLKHRSEEREVPPSLSSSFEGLSRVGTEFAEPFGPDNRQLSFRCERDLKHWPFVR